MEKMHEKYGEIPISEMGWFFVSGYPAYVLQNLTLDSYTVYTIKDDADSFIGYINALFDPADDPENDPNTPVDAITIGLVKTE